VAELARILDRLAGDLGVPEHDPIPLSGGITNRNYRVRLGGEDYVLRVCGRDTELLGIDRDAECAATRAGHGAGVAPAVVAWLPEHRCLVTRFVHARPLEAAGVRARVAGVAAALRAVHRSGVTVPATFSAFRIHEAYRDTSLARGGAVPSAYAEAARVAAIIEAALPPEPPVLCHDDLLTANLLDEGGRLWIVDWEYAGMGDPFFDLGNLSVNNGFQVDDDRRLVEAYFGGPDDRVVARVRVMRVMSDLREAMWGVVQQTLSDLDFDFAGYADEHFERMLGADWKEWLDAATA
jgi:aminoglycoside phosphotransferase (APT) family kinase protein